MLKVLINSKLALLLCFLLFSKCSSNDDEIEEEGENDEHHDDDDHDDEDYEDFLEIVQDLFPDQQELENILSGAGLLENFRKEILRVMQPRLTP